MPRGERGGSNRGGGGAGGGNRDNRSSSSSTEAPGNFKRERRGVRDRDRQREEKREELEERVVDLARTAKVVKGGRRFAFRAVVVVGDKKGRVGVGIGKAREVPDAIRKAGERARKMMVRVSLLGSTIPHPVEADFGAGKVFLKPASPGTGVIAGGGVRAVVECCGVSDILSKSLGSSNVLNVVQATFTALQQLRDFRVDAASRGIDAKYMMPYWYKEEAHG